MDFSAVTTDQLAELIGFAYRTIRTRLAGLAPVRRKGRVRYFDPRAALELVCQAEAVNPAREKARLDRLRADKVELDLSAQRETLVHVDEVSQEWRKISAEMQAHLLAFPVRAAPLIVGCKRMPVAKSILEKEVYACLESLHSGDNRYIAAD